MNLVFYKAQKSLLKMKVKYRHLLRQIKSERSKPQIGLKEVLEAGEYDTRRNLDQHKE